MYGEFHQYNYEISVKYSVHSKFNMPTHTTEKIYIYMLRRFSGECRVRSSKKAAAVCPLYFLECWWTKEHLLLLYMLAETTLIAE